MSPSTHINIVRSLLLCFLLVGCSGGDLVGEEEYEQARKEAHRDYDKIPSDQICAQATQEIARSWTLYGVNREFLQKNVDPSTAQKIWESVTGSLYKSIGGLLPLDLPTLPKDKLAYAASQVQAHRRNIDEWVSVYDALCK